MNWDQIEGAWKELKGKAKSQWGRLTDDDIDNVEGRREQLAGVLQQRYGKTRAEVDKEIDKWMSTIK